MPKAPSEGQRELARRISSRGVGQARPQKARARAAQSGVRKPTRQLAKQRTKRQARVRAQAQEARKGGGGGLSLGGILSAVKDAGADLGGDIVDALGYTVSPVMSGVKEVTDLLNQNPLPKIEGGLLTGPNPDIEDSDFSWDDFVRQTKDKYLGSQLLESQGVKNPVAQTVGGFALDVGLDPLTYIGIPRALRNPNNVTETIADASVAAKRAGKADEAAKLEAEAAKVVRQRTARNVPSDVLEEVGLPRKGLTLGGNALPGTEKVYEALSAPFTRARTAAGDAADKLGIRHSLSGATADLKRTARAADSTPEQTLQAHFSRLGTSAARSVGKGLGNKYKTELANILRNVDPKNHHLLQEVAETPDNAASAARALFGEEQSRAAKEWYARLHADAAGAGIKLGKQEDYFPRFISDALKETKRGKSFGGAVDAWAKARKLKAGEQLTSPDGREIVTLTGSQKQMRDQIVDFYQRHHGIDPYRTDYTDVSFAYADSVARRIAGENAQAELIERGFVKPAQSIETAKQAIHGGPTVADIEKQLQEAQDALSRGPAISEGLESTTFRQREMDHLAALEQHPPGTTEHMLHSWAAQRNRMVAQQIENGEKALDLDGQLKFLRSQEGQELHEALMLDTLRQTITQQPKLAHDPSVAAALTSLFEQLAPARRGAFLRSYDQALNAWKGLAIFSPGFISRNLQGGLGNNLLFAKVGADSHMWYVRLRLAEKRGAASLDKAVAKAAKHYRVDPARVRDVWEEMRLFAHQGQTHTEFLAHEGLLGKYGPSNLLGGQYTRAGRVAKRLNPLHDMGVANQAAEDFLRGSLALDVMMKGGTADDALDGITKFHFDYDDLSRFERGVKRVIPFYVWTRHNFPLMWEQLVRHPGVFNKVGLLKDEVEAQSGSLDAVVPSWFQEAGAIQLPFEKGGGHVYILPDAPIKDVLNPPDSLDDILSMVGPAKLPLEILQGQQFFKGLPLNDNLSSSPEAWDWAMPVLSAIGLAEKRGDDYYMSGKQAYIVDSVLPTVGKLRRLFPGKGESEKGYRQRRMTTWISFLLGGGIRTNTSTEQMQEVLRRSKAAEEALATKAVTDRERIRAWRVGQVNDMKYKAANGIPLNKFERETLRNPNKWINSKIEQREDDASKVLRNPERYLLPPLTTQKR